MKLIGTAFGIAVMFAAGTAAQTQTMHREDNTKIEIKDGKKVTVHGCLEQTAAGAYIVTNDEGGLKYQLVTNKDLSKDVGHLVQVHGKAADRGDAKVKIETESKVGTTGSTATTTTDESKAELKGDLGLKFLGVDSIKRLAKSCR